MNSTIIKAFDIVRLVADSQGELGLSDVCERLGMNKTTVFRYIETLVSIGLLEKRGGSYYLGIGLFEMGNKVRINNLIIEWVHPLLESLAQEVNETVNLAQIFDDTALYLDKAESRRSLQLKAMVGDKLPLHCTGLGKAILSILEPERLEPLIENLKLEKKTAHTITDPVEIRKQIESIGTRGYVIDQEEFDEGLVCVAVPLKMPELSFYGSISVSGPINRFNQARAEFLGGKLLATRDKILQVLDNEMRRFP